MALSQAAETSQVHAKATINLMATMPRLWKASVRQEAELGRVLELDFRDDFIPVLSPSTLWLKPCRQARFGI